MCPRSFAGCIGVNTPKRIGKYFWWCYGTEKVLIRFTVVKKIITQTRWIEITWTCTYAAAKISHLFKGRRFLDDRLAQIIHPDSNLSTLANFKDNESYDCWSNILYSNVNQKGVKFVSESCQVRILFSVFF